MSAQEKHSTMQYPLNDFTKLLRRPVESAVELRRSALTAAMSVDKSTWPRPQNGRKKTTPQKKIPE